MSRLPFHLKKRPSLASQQAQKREERLKRKLREKPIIYNADPDIADTIYDFIVRDVTGQPVSLKKYRGHFCIFSNIALKSGFTEWNFMLFKRLYETFGDREDGLRILLFPCNQFDEAETQLRTQDYVKFVADSGLSADLYGKINVNCDHGSTVWKFLKTKVNIGEKRFIKNPYEKFLVDREGQPARRFGAYVELSEIEDAIYSLDPTATRPGPRPRKYKKIEFASESSDKQ